jgi:hypothetical protein
MSFMNTVAKWKWFIEFMKHTILDNTNEIINKS